MSKETLLEIIFGTIGGLIFAIGMCMCLIPEWNMFKIGVIVSIIGLIVLISIIPIYKKAHPNYNNKAINWKIVLTWIIGIVGALIMGFGMSRIMVNNASGLNMIVGIIIGTIGLIICVLNYPIYAYIKSNKN